MTTEAAKKYGDTSGTYAESDELQAKYNDLLGYVDAIEKKLPGDGLLAVKVERLLAELAFQRQRAYMRNDIVSADRISLLIGAKLPSVHEGEGK